MATGHVEGADRADGRANADLGARVFRLRLERGLTQQQLAGQRYTRAYVSSVEANRRRPSPRALRHFAARLRVSYDELAFGRPPHAPADLDAALDRARRVLSAGDVDGATRLYGQVDSAAMRYGLVWARAAARGGVAEVALHAGHPRSAAAFFREGEELLADAGLTARAPYVARRAHCVFILGQLNDAVRLLESALAELGGGGDPAARCRLHGALVGPYFEMGSPERAGRSAREALRLAERVSSPEDVARVHLSAARVFLAEGLADQAMAILGRAEELFTRVGLDAEVGRCHWSRGYMLTRLGRLDEAAAELEVARAVARRTGAREELGGATSELAEVTYRMGMLDQTERLAREAVAVCSAAGVVAVMAEGYRLLGLVARDRGDGSTAERLLSRALGLFERAGVRRDVAATCRVLGDLALEAGRVDDAVGVLRQGLVAAETTD